MPIYRKPVVDQWYRHLDKGAPFQVVAIDDGDGTVEIQHFDGDLEEVDLADWYVLEVEPIEAPEDWTGPVDTVKRDELGYSETDMTQEDWEAPLREAGVPEVEGEAEEEE